MASQDSGAGGWGGEDGNSLFEGMVLFAPEPVAAEEPPPSPGPEPPAARPDADAASSQTPAAPPPLDEDLFSDLTLLAPQEPSPLEQQLPLPLGEDRAFPAPADAPSSPSTAPSSSAPAPSAPASALSRQTSSSSLRKKKRAVRIGYGRSPQPAPPAPLPTAAIPATAAVATICTSSSTLTDDSPYPAAPLTPDWHPVEQVHVYGHGGEQITVDILDPVDNSVRVEKDAKEEDGEKENGAGVAAEVGVQERLAILRSQISGKLESIQQRAAAVVAKRRQLAARRRKVAEEVGSAASRHKDMERELEEACEGEDFERAERISNSIAALEKEKDQLLMALRDAEVDYDSVDSELQDVLESHIDAEEEAAALLEQFAKDATDHADSEREQTQEMSLKEIEEWQTSMELLETRKLEMQVETQLVLAARSGLEGSIEHLVEGDKKEKDMLNKKGEILTGELASLLELMRLKEAEIAENNVRIHEVQERISAMVTRFHGSQSDIDLKLNSLQEAETKVLLETETLALKKSEIDKFVSLTEQKDSELREIICACSSETKACQQSVEMRRKLASSILKSREDRNGLLKMEEEILQDIQTVRQQITDARNSLQEISSRRVGIQQEMASFKQKLSFIDKRGPELEAEKKIAAAARNFKEAGRIAAEAKALNSEKEELHAKLEKASNDLEIIEKDVVATTDKIHECEGLIVLKEKQSAMTSYKRLWLDCAAARTELTAATETDDKEEVEILRKEAEAAESKAMELKSCYDLQVEDGEFMFQPVVPIAFITNSTGQHLAEISSSFGLSPQK